MIVSKTNCNSGFMLILMKGLVMKNTKVNEQVNHDTTNKLAAFVLCGVEILSDATLSEIVSSSDSIWTEDKRRKAADELTRRSCLQTD